MGLFSTATSANKAAPAGNESSPGPSQSSATEKSPDSQSQQDDAPESDQVVDQKDEFSTEAQAGVLKMEATAAVWTKWHLIAAYGMIWLIYFVTSVQEVVIRAFVPFVTSSFGTHSLLAATNIMSTIIAGLTKLPLAKVLDIWGRPHGMALMLICWVIGNIMMAACDNIEMYAAAQVFSLVGSQGVSYCMTVFIADTSSLKNRGLMLAFATSPYIVTTWIGGPMSEAFIHGAGWRWGFGVFTIIVPVVIIPLILLFLWSERRAKNLGLLSTIKPEVNTTSFKQFIIDFDLLGIFLLAAGIALFDLALATWSYQTLQWKSPMFISMIIIGGVLVIVFVLYEAFVAPVNFIPLHLLGDRTVFFAGLMMFFVFMNSAVWGTYFTSMLMVVWNQTLTRATYISNIYRVGSCFSALVIGYLIRRTGRFKWVALYFAMPLMILGVGLMIRYREPDSDIGLIIMTQIFVAFAGGPLVVSAEIAMMAVISHQHFAATLAMLDLFGSVGYALGSAIAGAIWTGTFLPALRKHLPEGANIDMIYSSIYSQLGYRVGTPIRIGISQAYADAQRYMLITSVCALAAALGCVLFWRDLKIKNIRQLPGTVA
ncbi:major facilitator superfamily domain-containing protein [Cercophora scortea]|uniref:Major facilitator superfamily domain-containing protein n=1 Tax=Cercophora scortea TaxID=314031 RepID=A0AAE0I9Y9_9PEZI|nr:major facilitator superfamily domain-containing protein [Cercophora scortea]